MDNGHRDNIETRIFLNRFKTFQKLFKKTKSVRNTIIRNEMADWSSVGKSKQKGKWNWKKTVLKKENGHNYNYNWEERNRMKTNGLPL